MELATLNQTLWTLRKLSIWLIKKQYEGFLDTMVSPHKISNVIQSLYKDASRHVLRNSYLSAPFEVNTGVRQGYPTIPFNIFTGN